MNPLVLIADDDPVQRRLLDAMVRRFGYDVETVDGGEAALARLEAADKPAVGILILDLVMPDLDGMGVLGRMRERGIPVPVIVQTAHGSIEAVISAMRAGAGDFVVKPVGAERLQISIKNVLKTDALESEVRRMTRKASGTLGFKDIATRSPEMERIIRLGERAAKSTIPVLIEGESGVGKELIARAIQGGSDRKGKPFVTVNCGALPKISSSPSSLATRKAPSQAQRKSTPASSSRLMAARSSSTKSVNCHWKRRSSYCAPCRKAKSIQSAARGRSRSMCA